MQTQDTPFAVYDPDGYFIALVAPGYVARAVRSGELTIERPGQARLRRSAIRPLNELSPEAKRRLFLKRQRA